MLHEFPVVVEPACAGGDREVLRQVVAELAEHRVVAIDTNLLGEPERVRPPRHFVRLGQIVDQVALFDAVLLALREQTADEAQAVLDRRREANLVAVFLIPIAALDELPRIDEIAGVVVEINAGAV